jgi:hypothetical protein
MAEVTSLNIDQIHVDDKTQCRQQVNRDRIAELADVLR